MTVEFVVLVVSVGLLCGCWYVVRLVRRQRRRAGTTMFVTTYPDIELGQEYGGWDADGYDVGAGQVHAELMFRIQLGPPSTWARLH